MNEKQKYEYLKNPTKCPYCKSGNICLGKTEVGGKETHQIVDCNECHKTWKDIYTLKSVEEVK